MYSTSQIETDQEAIHLQSAIKTFFDNFSVGTLLNRCGMKKLKGISPLAVFEAIFLLAFRGQNFYRGIVLNSELGFQKDVAYDLLENPRYNWRQFVMRLAVKIVRVVELLTNEEREKVLVIDDSDYDRSRSKTVELLARIFDHNSRKYLKGFKLLTLGWSDIPAAGLRFAIFGQRRQSYPRDHQRARQKDVRAQTPPGGDDQDYGVA